MNKCDPKARISRYPSSAFVVRLIVGMISGCALAALSASVALAAEFSLCPPEEIALVHPERQFSTSCNSRIWFADAVRAGDYERFREFIKDNRDDILFGRASTRGISIVAGYDGNIRETIKIAKLIHRLELTTNIFDVYSDGFRWSNFSTSNSKFAVCENSCALLWLSGAFRTGRAELNLKSLSEYYEAANFLDRINLTESLKRRWLNLKSGEYLTLSFSETAEMNTAPQINASCAEIPLLICKNSEEVERVMKLFTDEFLK